MDKRGIDISGVILQDWTPMPEDWLLRAKLRKLTERVHELEQQVEMLESHSDIDRNGSEQ